MMVFEIDAVLTKTSLNCIVSRYDPRKQGNLKTGVNLTYDLGERFGTRTRK